MSLIETRRAQMFPVLTGPQIETARRFASAAPRRRAGHETVFATADLNVPAFLVLAGTVEVRAHDPAGADTDIVCHGPGEIVGEISQLAGRSAMVSARAGADGCELLEFDAPHLRALLIGSADLGELLMRAFLLRRAALISETGGGTVLVGAPADPALVRAAGFLARNGYPSTTIDAGSEDGRHLVERLGLHADDLPIALCPSGTVLRRPTEATIAAAIGITPTLDPDRVYDVAIVGAGPAGLATAVYAASEGLSVIVLEARAFGGQAGASARIENFFGFPTGITGQALTARAFTQAQKFGAEIAIPVSVETLDCGGDARRPGDPLIARLVDGGQVQARAVVIASGARYRKPAISNLADFEDAGVSYWASPVEARLCAGEEVALVGAGNSAGQAVAFLAPRVKRLHLVVRGAGLEQSMSRYLIDRIAALPNVVIHVRAEVTELTGDRGTGLTGASFRDRDTGKTWTGLLRHLFLFIGADPNTDWLSGCAVSVDAKGFVATGDSGWTDGPWRAFGRTPFPLETSVPGVFAIGDVRAGSTKRVAAAVGEGAQAVASIHALLEAARVRGAPAKAK